MGGDIHSEANSERYFYPKEVRKNASQHPREKIPSTTKVLREKRVIWNTESVQSVRGG